MPPTVLDRNAARGDFFTGFETGPAAEALRALAIETNSDAAQENYAWLDAIPDAEEWEGETSIYVPKADELAVKNKVWRSTAGLPIDTVRRDKTGSVSRRMQQLGQIVASKPWAVVLDLIKNGDTTTFGTAFDGEKFFDTDHPNAAGAQKNALTATEVPQLTVSSATDPTPEEMVEAILGITGYMHNIVDSTGRPMNEFAREFVVMYKPTPGMHGAVVAALSSNHLASGEVNPLLAPGSPYKFVAVPSPRLDWTTEIAIFRTDGITKPFVVQTEVPADVTFLPSDDSYVQLKRMEVAIGEMIGGVGYGQWEYAAKGTFST